MNPARALAKEFRPQHGKQDAASEEHDDVSSEQHGRLSDSQRSAASPTPTGLTFCDILSGYNVFRVPTPSNVTDGHCTPCELKGGKASCSASSVPFSLDMSPLMLDA